VDGFILGVAGTYATYQWLKDGMLIPGATDSFYTVTANGDYQVVVTNGNGCLDTSGVYPVTNYTGIEDIHVLSSQIKVYPNPATDFLHIQSPVKINAAITDVAGKTIREIKNARNVSLKGLAEGIYLMQISDVNHHLIKVEKFIKAK